MKLKFFQLNVFVTDMVEIESLQYYFLCRGFVQVTLHDCVIDSVKERAFD